MTSSNIISMCASLLGAAILTHSAPAQSLTASFNDDLFNQTLLWETDFTTNAGWGNVSGTSAYIDTANGWLTTNNDSGVSGPYATLTHSAVLGQNLNLEQAGRDLTTTALYFKARYDGTTSNDTLWVRLRGAAPEGPMRNIAVGLRGNGTMLALGMGSHERLLETGGHEAIANRDVSGIHTNMNATDIPREYRLVMQASAESGKLTLAFDWHGGNPMRWQRASMLEIDDYKTELGGHSNVNMLSVFFRTTGELVYDMAITQSAAREVLTYPKAFYTQTSSVFSVTADGKPVDVVRFMDYHYAHFSFDGTIALDVTANQNISSRTISPVSKGIAGTVSGNTLSFDLQPVLDASTTPNYYVIQINSLEKLVILADPLERSAPLPSGIGIYNVTQSPYNADDTGSTNATAALQQAIDDASAAGGGTVYVPPGVYKVVKRLFIKSNVTLHLAGGAAIRSTTSRSEMINADMAFFSSGTNDWRIRPVIERPGTESNITIRGRGIVDASGIALMDTQTLEYRRRAIDLLRVNGLTVEGITLKDATGWTMRINRSEDILVENVKVLNHSNVSQYKIQNDGINISSSEYALVNRCFVKTVDDPFCSKAETIDWDTRDIAFSNSVVFCSTAGVKAGMQSRGLMYNIWFDNIDVVQCRRGVVVESKTGDRRIEKIHFQNIRVEKQIPTSAGPERNVEIYARDADIWRVLLDNITFQEDHSRLLNAPSGRQINRVYFNDVRYGPGQTLLTGTGQLTTTGHVTNTKFNEAINW